MKSRQEADKWTIILVFCMVFISLVFKVISATCEEGCVCDNDKCMKCKDSYFRDRTGCTKCIFRCQKCSSLDKCDECAESSVSVNGSCEPCPDGCASCSSYYGSCRQCLPSYYLDTNGYCYSCPENCRMCSSARVCDVCEDRSFRNESTYLCAKCPINCVSCNSSKYCMVCQAGFYGPECEYKCLSRCRNNRCDKDTGDCRCKDGLYEPNCSYRCPRNCVSCHLTSNCSTCQRNVHDLSCETCVEGKHGVQCDKDCPENCKTCNREGNCTQCIPVFHGSNCQSSCGAGCQNGTCSMKSGVCVEGCVNGTYGPYCLHTEVGFSPKLRLFGIYGGVALLICFSVVLTVCLIKNRRKFRHRDRNGSENNGPVPEASDYLHLDHLNRPSTNSTNDYSTLNMHEDGLYEASHEYVDVNPSTDSQRARETKEEEEKTKGFRRWEIQHTSEMCGH